ncbi:hypothetical protein QBC38DRAFT_460027 [Podospora fimiseda]|uniref:C2H2-type domain-containing protein n=1 Tax=Podospora fimiseda TaxID=252190 RepID=A0AAN6YP08_9PEZI|nr:hypothetical protein QBC38DRAFT_460027 [Podospora fimiseda]
MTPLKDSATPDRLGVSVSALTHNCIPLFRALKDASGAPTAGIVENRLADFRLWADDVGALAKPGASLDSRFQSRPHDLALVKGVLVMLADFLDESIPLAEQSCSVDDTLVNIDSAIMNLAMIGMAIRQTGRASRSRRADQSFRPDDHTEFRKHLECIVLLRPNPDQPAFQWPRPADSIPSESADAFSARLASLGPSKLNILQKRLIEANLRRRHCFLVAQRRSQRMTQVRTQQKTTNTQKYPVRATVSALSNLTSTETDASIRIPHAPSPSKPVVQAPASIAILSKASTAEGTLQYKSVKRHMPQIARSQISFIAADTEFPMAPAPCESQLVRKCPCCCQSLPSQIFESPTEWKRHLIEDLCPYTCIAEQCPTPQLLFASRKAWETHVEKDHPTQWQCALCQEKPILLRLAQHIEDHITTYHPEELLSSSLSTLISWSEVQRLGIRSCPLCSSYGPEDSTELVDHVVRHTYEFALRSLPWADSPEEDLDKPVGIYILPEHPEKANWLTRWIENAYHVTENPTLQFSAYDSMTHTVPVGHGFHSNHQDYFVLNDYFDDKDLARSSRRQAGEPSERSWVDDIGPAPDQQSQASGSSTSGSIQITQPQPQFRGPLEQKSALPESQPISSIENRYLSDFGFLLPPLPESECESPIENSHLSNFGLLLPPLPESRPETPVTPVKNLTLKTSSSVWSWPAPGEYSDPNFGLLLPPLPESLPETPITPIENLKLVTSSSVFSMFGGGKRVR